MRRALLVVSLLLAALAAASPAYAVVDTSQIATALAKDPLYVDPSFEDVFPPSQQRQVRDAIRAQDVPFYVVLVPLRKGDRFDGDVTSFSTALQARVGDTSAAYVVYSEYSPRTRADDDALDERLRQAADVAQSEVEFDGPIGDQLLALLDAFADPDLPALAEGANEQQQREYEENADRYDDGVPVWLIVVGALVLLAAFGGFRMRRTFRREPGAGRGGRVVKDAPPLLPERVFEYARQARFEDLRDRAREETIKLSETIDEQPTPKRGPALAAYERAVESAAAASKLHDRATRIVELAGVLVLVDDGREALREAADLAAGHRHQAAKPLCFFDPLHGRSVREVRWAGRDVAACTACARDVKAGKDPEALREDGVPWFERDGALAATGMGHFAKDLPARLARGDVP